TLGAVAQGSVEDAALAVGADRATDSQVADVSWKARLFGKTQELQEESKGDSFVLTPRNGFHDDEAATFSPGRGREAITLPSRPSPGGDSIAFVHLAAPIGLAPPANNRPLGRFSVRPATSP